MIDLLSGLHVVDKTINLEISRCRLADYAKKMLLKRVPHVQHNYFFLIQPIRSLFSGAVFAVVFVLAKNSLINAMKRRLGAGESYVNGNVKSVANDFHGILRLLRKVKDFIYVRCWWSITSRFMLRLSHWVE